MIPMIELVVEQIVDLVDQAEDLEQRLIIVAGPPSAGKSKALRLTHEQTHTPMLELTPLLARRLFPLSEVQRVAQLPMILEEIIQSFDGPAILLDDIDILFREELAQEPMNLLQHLCKEKVLIVAWPGKVETDGITYSRFGDPEYKKYPLGNFALIDLS